MSFFQSTSIFHLFAHKYQNVCRGQTNTQLSLRSITHWGMSRSRLMYRVTQFIIQELLTQFFLKLLIEAVTFLSRKMGVWKKHSKKHCPLIAKWIGESLRECSELFLSSFVTDSGYSAMPKSCLFPITKLRTWPFLVIQIKDKGLTTWRTIHW